MSEGARRGAGGAGSAGGGDGRRDGGATGETDLTRLIAGMRPHLQEGLYGFASVQTAPEGLKTVCLFAEEEGLSLIAAWDDLIAAGLSPDYPCRWITLEIASALEAVGFLAAVTGRLAAEGISVNPVSARFHDHLFVPEDRAGETMAILRAMAEG